MTVNPIIFTLIHTYNFNYIYEQRIGDLKTLGVPIIIGISLAVLLHTLILLRPPRIITVFLLILPAILLFRGSGVMVFKQDGRGDTYNGTKEV